MHNTSYIVFVYYLICVCLLFLFVPLGCADSLAGAERALKKQRDIHCVKQSFRQCDLHRVQQSLREWDTQ